MDNQIAITIIEQLGGQGRLKAMIGANTYIALDNGVTFKFKGSRKWNMLKVTLNALDLYDITFMKYSPSKYKVIKENELNLIFAEDMKQLFEQETKLYLSL